MKTSRSYSSYYGNDEKYRVNEFKDIAVSVSLIDRKRIKHFIREEGGYYNSIISIVSPYMRTSRDYLLYVFENKIDILKKLSSGKLNISDESITERDRHIFKLAIGNFNIIPEMKNDMLSEIISYYIRLIKEMDSTTDKFGEIVYSKPIELLHDVDLYKKNTIQIKKSLLKMEKVSDDSTKIWCQYFSDFIIVPVDLIKNRNWNLLIVKYNYDRNNNESWSISTRKINAQYILKQSTITSKKY